MPKRVRAFCSFGKYRNIEVEDGKLTFWRLRVPEPQFNSEYTGGFGHPEC